MIYRLPDEVRAIASPPFPAVAYEDDNGHLIVEVDRTLTGRRLAAAIAAVTRPHTAATPAPVSLPMAAGWETLRDASSRPSGMSHPRTRRGCS